jgi:tRNA-2-methylthio-N6-dimethylallyladenosine synthase
MPSVFIKTYGCQMNERDSEAVAAEFLAHGYTLAHSEDRADVVLLNTCSVREGAEQKALGKMAALASDARRNRSNVVLGFLGCMAQNRGRSLLERMPRVGLVLGTQKLHRAVEYVESLRRGGPDAICDTQEEAGSEEALRGHLAGPSGGAGRVRAFVNIMQGCNERCTFCVVPQTRGNERSRALPDILEEVRGLVAQGVREVTLLGQIVTSYGRDTTAGGAAPSPFVRLLDAVDGVEGLARIRFTSPHPRGYGADLVEAYRRLPRLCESAHLPAQSGSDRVLRAMGRRHTRDQYLRLVESLRAAQPAIGLSTDLIAGFPGETGRDFQDTLSLVREAGFDSAFVFKYSSRPGTAATRLPGQIPAEVRDARHTELLRLVSEVGARKYQALVGRKVQVLVEGPSRKNPQRLEGRTRCNKIVVFEGPPRLVGRVLDVQVLRASAVTLYGDPAIHNPD